MSKSVTAAVQDESLEHSEPKIKKGYLARYANGSSADKELY